MNPKKNIPVKPTEPDWELDLDERDLAEKMAADWSSQKASRTPEELGKFEIEIVAHESHRWSPVTHYLEPYL